jgi:hypothetical protein
MEILVNQEPLSYSLETGDSLGDVIDEVATWLNDGSFTITAIDVDDTSLPIHDRSRWDDVEIEAVRQLSIQAFPVDQVQLTTIAALADYCVLLERALDDRDSDAVADLAAELPYVRERLVQIFPGISVADETGGPLSSGSLDRGDVPAPDECTRLKIQLGGLVSILESRLRELENPLREFGLTLGQLAAFRHELEAVPVKLQTGRESEAMKTVVQFAELLSKVLRVLPHVDKEAEIDPAGISQFALDLTPVLQQLQDAFEAQDSVLIGDLLEYEVVPRLAELPSVVPAGPASEEPAEE